MFYLILKDVLILKRTLFLIAAFVALHFTLQSSPVFAITFAGLIFISSAGSFEDRSNSHILLNSLPIDRKVIISSKYIGAILFGVFAIGLSFAFQPIYYYIFKAYPQPFPEIKHMIISMIIILIITSIYYPIFYKFGEKYVRIVSILLTVCILIFGQIIFYFLKDQVIKFQQIFAQFSEAQLIILGIIITSLIYLLSWLGSIKIYEAKDF